jgi:hypothetical protein
MEKNLEALLVTRKTGLEHFILHNQQTNLNLLGFWQWSGSDLSNNAFRGMLAEYIVACDLGLNNGTRVEWDVYDLVTSEGIKVEVKSSAYLQSWHQSKLSKIEFNICPTNGWEANSNTYSIERKRQADVYVFSLLKHLDKSTLNPLNLDQWDFYVLPTFVLNTKIPNQQKIGLNRLIKLNPVKTKFGQIKEAIQNLFQSEENLKI